MIFYYRTPSQRNYQVVIVPSRLILTEILRLVIINNQLRFYIGVQSKSLSTINELKEDKTTPYYPISND
jgi:hypothetical protein